MEKASYFFAALIPAVFAITVHEVAHGWVANRCGDSTAADLGRLSLNPIKHVDPLGSLLVPFGLYCCSLIIGAPPFFFGWAKPVPIQSDNFSHPRRDIALVAVAGPGANLLMLIAWCVFLHVLRINGASGSLLYMCYVGIMLNATIMVINLLPIPPLDGSRILTSAMPARAGKFFNRLEPFGMLGIVALLAILISTNVLDFLLNPILRLVMNLV
ncbi:MAG: site-2 protease family protein [Pseudomonadota bacterium]